MPSKSGCAIFAANHLVHTALAEAKPYLFNIIDKTPPSVSYRGSAITTRDYAQLIHDAQMAWDAQCQVNEDEAKRKKAPPQ